MDYTISLLPADERDRRLGSVRRLMAAEGVDALLVCDLSNIYYLTGRVFAGHIYIGSREGDVIYFVKRPSMLEGDGVVRIRKPEQMAESIGLSAPATLGLELDLISATMAQRLGATFAGATVVNGTGIMRQARAVKTEYELSKLRRSGVLHEECYRQIPKLFEEGMTDIELEIEIERELRLKGCLGQFRISGDSMETFMGTLIAGKNADAPSPYDFAMGGEGLDPSLPMGAHGEIIRPGDTVMVDLCGNFTGYMTDMTRVFSLGEIPELARKAHDCSRAIHARLRKDAVPGAKASDLYGTAMQMVEEAGLKEYFMGHRQQAGFIGHGVGIEINELPVIAPRSRDILAEHNVIALEPKFVIPGCGAVGIENTYIVTRDGLECITNAPEEIRPLDE